MISIENLRVNNTVQRVDDKKSSEIVTVDTLSLIKMYNEKGSGCPYEYKEITTDWLLDKGFVKLPREEGVYAYKRHFFIAETNRGYEYLPNVVEFRSYGTPKKFCHQIENLYHDLFDETDKPTEK